MSAVSRDGRGSTTARLDRRDLVRTIAGAGCTVAGPAAMEPRCRAGFEPAEAGCRFVAPRMRAWRQRRRAVAPWFTLLATTDDPHRADSRR